MAAGDVVSGSQVNRTDRAMMSEQPWSSGVCVVEVWVELLPCGQVEVRAELSDGCFLRLIRTDGDLARMMKRLVDAFPEDRETLSSSLLTGLLRVRAAEQMSNPRVKILEVNKLLKTIINLPHKFSQSEAVVAFFEPSPWDRTFRLLGGSSVRAKENQTITVKEEETIRPEEDRTFGPKETQTIKVEEKEQTFGPGEDLTTRPKEDETFGPVKEWTVRLQDDLSVAAEKYQTIRAVEEQSHGVGEGPRRGSVDQTIRSEMGRTIREEEEQPLDVFQTSVVLSEVLRSNGFCLANTETILFDLTPPTHPVTRADDSSGRRDDGQTSEEAEPEMQVQPSTLSLHLRLTWAQETDILD